jgi:hypothetical protein
MPSASPTRILSRSKPDRCAQRDKNHDDRRLGRKWDGERRAANWGVHQKDQTRVHFEPFVGAGAVYVFRKEFVGFHDNLDGFLAGVDLDPDPLFREIDFVPTTGFAQE